MNPPPPVGLVRQLLLLWGLRWRLAQGALPRGATRLPALAGPLLLGLFALLAAHATNRLFSSELLLGDLRLFEFLVLLLGFLASTLWMTWPMITASVDDSAELSRFALFPVSPLRLFLASLGAALVEPRTLPVWGALAGAAWALWRNIGGHLVVFVPATLLLGACSVAWGRAGLHLLLNVLRHRRSAEAMGAGLLLFLGLALFVPPPDLSWLKQLSGGTPKIDGRLIDGASALFSLLPCGGWGWALMADAGGHRRTMVLALSFLLVATIVGALLAYWLLLRFYRHAGRALPQPVAADRARSAAVEGGLFPVLVRREWRDWLLNPRARLMLALPFFLAILLKLVGARALAQALVGPQADAWLVGGLTSYGALVLAAGFSQNVFGYDGAGVQLYLTAPVDLAVVMRAKNLVHGGVALALTGALVAFYALAIAPPPPWVVAMALANALFQVLVLVATGNVLSIVLPRRFHPSLKRRDKPDALTIAAGLAAAAVAVFPGSMALRLFPGEEPSLAMQAALWLLPIAGAILWRRSLDLALRLLPTRRAELVRLVARG